jgi:heme-degrading monooxygenase HmoA
VFARVIAAGAASDSIDTAIRVARDQLPAAEAQPGFSGFCLLVDRAAGKVMTISLWESGLSTSMKPALRLPDWS